MSKDRPRIKNEEQYEALRDKGYSKEKSARIANTEDSGEKAARLKSMKIEPRRSCMSRQKKWVSKEDPI